MYHNLPRLSTISSSFTLLGRACQWIGFKSNISAAIVVFGSRLYSKLQCLHSMKLIWWHGTAGVTQLNQLTHCHTAATETFHIVMYLLCLNQCYKLCAKAFIGIMPPPSHPPSIVQLTKQRQSPLHPFRRMLSAWQRMVHDEICGMACSESVVNKTQKQL